MSATPVPWLDWYSSELADLRALLTDDRIHPSGATVCLSWLGELEQAASEGQHAEAARFAARIGAKVEQELGWYAERLETAQRRGA